MAFRMEKEECRLRVDSRLAQKEVLGQGRPASRRLCWDCSQFFVSMEAAPQPLTCTEPSAVGKELFHLLSHLASKQLRRPG